MPLTKLKAAAYIRVSTTMQAEEGSSLAEQRETLTKRIEAEGWELADVYADEGLSGKRDDRPELQRMLRDLPRLDRVVVTELSRLGRRAAGMLALFDQLAAEDVALVAIRQSIDTSSAAGRLLRNVLVSVAEFESEQLGERVAAVNRSRTAKGIHHGRAPYGYRNEGAELIQIPEQAAVVRRIFKSYEAGTGQRIIARELNEEGIKPQKAKRWSQSSIARILSNPTYKGRVEINGEQYAGTHKRIVSPALWDRVETMRSKAARTRDGGPGRLPSGPHLFTRGLLRHECGAAMTPRTIKERNGSVREVYLCMTHVEDGDKGCPLPPVERKAIDLAAIDYFQRAALDADTMRAELETAMSERRRLIVAQVADAEDEAAKAAERMQRVRSAFQDGNLDADDYREQYAELSEAQTAATARAELARQREAEFVAAESSDDDPVDLAVERLAAIREAVAGRVADVNGIDAVRAALTEMFDAFTLMQVPAGIPAGPLPEAEATAAARVKEQARLHFARDGIEAIPVGSFVVWPEPKREVVEGLDEALSPVLRRRGIGPATMDPKGFAR